MTGLSQGSQDYIKEGYFELPQVTTTLYRNFTPPGVLRDVKIFRKVSSADVETMELDKMPGFRISWWYTNSAGVEVKNLPYYYPYYSSDKKTNKNNIRLIG